MHLLEVLALTIVKTQELYLQHVLALKLPH
jgi:hypothetical protein